MNERDTGRAVFPPCRRCGQGDLVPLSDYGGQGVPVRYKAWVCTNPACGFNLKIRNGEVFVNEPIIDAAGGPHVPPPRRPPPLPGHDGVGQGH
jgi:hypothetical protein